MSSELITISKSAIAKLKMEEPQLRLTRTSSLDKIKKFNMFICSQQYYILPALLSWLRSSQSNLQRTMECTIYFLRTFLLNAYLNFYSVVFKNQSFNIEKTQIVAKQLTATVIANFFEKFSKCFESTYLLGAGVYMGCLLVFVQLLFSIYLIYLIFLPLGFIFLVCCILAIQYMHYKTIVNVMEPKTMRKEKKQK